MPDRGTVRQPHLKPGTLILAGHSVRRIVERTPRRVYVVREAELPCFAPGALDVRGWSNSERGQYVDLGTTPAITVHDIEMVRGALDAWRALDAGIAADIEVLQQRRRDARLALIKTLRQLEKDAAADPVSPGACGDHKRKESS